MEDNTPGMIIIVSACLCAIMTCIFACFNLAAAGIAGCVTFVLLCAAAISYGFP